MAEAKNTSDRLKSLLADMKLPTKRDIIQATIGELKDVFFDSKMKELILSILDGVEINIQAKIQLKHKNRKNNRHSRLTSIQKRKTT